MTTRKPADATWETWVERQIRQAMERGEFDNLPGAGKPLPDANQPYQELWWINRKLAAEKLTNLPPSLILRKDAATAYEAALAAPTEDRARAIIEAINTRIAAAIRNPPPGPALNLVPFNIRKVLKTRRTNQGS
ncbi:DnaJ family domain-containing protein [Crossiella sp. NPDC003009]